MKTLTVGKKITLACMALVALTIILGTVSAWKIRGMNADLHYIVEGPLPGIYSLGLIEGFAKEQKLAIVEHIASADPDQKSRIEATIAELEGKLQAEMKSYEKTITSARGRELFEKVAPAHELLRGVWTQVLPLSRAMKTKEAMASWDGASSVSEQQARVIDELLEYRRELGEESGKSAIAAGESALFRTVLIMGFAALAGAVMAFFIVGGITAVLTRAVVELSEGAEQVSSAAGQVSGSSQSLAQGASEQAASLEETSASSEEMSSMTRKNSENSQQAAQFMTAVNQRVVEANRTLAGMMTSMQEIGASSNKISKIIRVIDEIAFQTNILALNAAVEAARAGEAGMGFAVVADEVRNLAQRSAQAARDTAGLIEESILKSADGSTRLGEVAVSIQAITDGATKVKTLVDEVEASSREQAQGIEQIAKAVAQMDEVTQRTAASAEESASASEELNAQSRALVAVVEELRTMVGATSKAPVKAPVQASARHTRQPEMAVAYARTPVSASTRVGTPTGIPLDDSEFREF